MKIDVRSCVQVSEQFAAWLKKMLEPDLEKRFTSAEALNALITKRKIKTKKTAIRPKIKFKLVIAIAWANVNLPLPAVL